MELTGEGARGARQFVFEVVTLICDNDQGAYNALTDAAREVVTGERGSTLEAYAAVRAAGPRGEGVWEVAGAAGEACADVVREWADTASGVAGLLLTDLLDFGDSALWSEIGWHYMPEPGDVDAEDFDGYEVEG